MTSVTSQAGIRYQNVSILDFTGAKGDGGGGDNWSYKTCKAPVKILYAKITKIGSSSLKL